MLRHRSRIKPKHQVSKKTPENVFTEDNGTETTIRKRLPMEEEKSGSGFCVRKRKVNRRDWRSTLNKYVADDQSNVLC